MEKRRKLNKFKIGIVVAIVLLIFTGAVFGRYIYNNIRETYFLAEKFYFSSDILTMNGSNYTYTNWGGSSVYQIDFELHSYTNELAKLDYDLGYTVTCSTTDTDKIKIGINSGEDNAPTTATGTIPASTNTKKVGIFVTPLRSLKSNESVTIQVTASTTEPYQKTISCTFTLKPETQGTNTYSIEDVANRDYAILKLSCPNDSSIVTLEFDPTKLRIDANDEIFINRDESKTETTTINGKSYVKKFVFELSAETTRYVKFYKVDISQNYTYPGVQATSPIKVTI